MMKRLLALVLALVMLTGIAACSGAGSDDKKEEESNAEIEEVMNNYMKYVTSGKYDKAVKLVQREDFNICTLFDFINDEQSQVIDVLLETTEYEITDIKVDDDKASCKLKLTVKDFEGLYAEYDGKVNMDDFLDELKDTSDTTTEKIKFNLVLDDETWLIESDSDFAVYYSDLVMEFVDSGKFNEDTVRDYVEDLLDSPELWYDLISASSDADILHGMFDGEEYEQVFLEEQYVNYVGYNYEVESIDEENCTAEVVINTYIPDTQELRNTACNNHDVIVYAMAGYYADEEYKNLAFEKSEQALLDDYASVLVSTMRVWDETHVTVWKNEDNEYGVSSDFGECFFTNFNVDELPELDMDFYDSCVIEGIEVAHNNGWIDDSTYEELMLEYNPVDVDNKEWALQVNDGVFYVYDGIFGMTYDEANEFFGGDFPATDVWEWGTYDSFFDYFVNGNKYTFFLTNGIVQAVRYEVVADSIPMNVLAQYEEWYGSPVSLTYTDGGDVIPLGENNSGYRFFTFYGFMDAFYNIYDDEVHIAYHAGLSWW